MSAGWAPWLGLIAAGAFHGLNPAMGWLFAVGLGLQERRRSALLGAFPFIAAGHALSVGLVVLIFSIIGFIVDPRILQLGGAAVIVAFGVYRLIRWRRHPRWVGMQVGPRDLVVWSFLMASAHGAGLMIVPLLLHLPAHLAYLSVPNQHVLLLSGGPLSPAVTAAAVAVHTAAMLAVSVTVALVVFETVGVDILRRVWINFDLPWAVALIGAGTLMAIL